MGEKPTIYPGYNKLRASPGLAGGGSTTWPFGRGFTAGPRAGSVGLRPFIFLLLLSSVLQGSFQGRAIDAKITGCTQLEMIHEIWYLERKRKGKNKGIEKMFFQKFTAVSRRMANLILYSEKVAVKHGEQHLTARKVQPKFNQSSPKFNQSSTKVQPKFNRSSTKVQPKFNQCSTKIEPKLNKSSTKVHPKFKHVDNFLAPKI